MDFEALGAHRVGSSLERTSGWEFAFFHFSSGALLFVGAHQAVLVAQLFGGDEGFGANDGVDAANC